MNITDALQTAASFVMITQLDGIESLQVGYFYLAFVSVSTGNMKTQKSVLFGKYIADGRRFAVFDGSDDYAPGFEFHCSVDEKNFTGLGFRSVCIDAENQINAG